MDNCKWEEFTNQINTNMTQHQVPLDTNTIESLKKTWHKINTCIITAALQHIPNKKYTIKHFHHTFIPKATKLHNDLKTIGNIIHRVKNFFSKNTPLLENLQQTI